MITDKIAIKDEAQFLNVPNRYENERAAKEAIEDMIKNGITIEYFLHFLPNVVSYPTDIGLNPLPLGTRYENMPHTFLNCFVNYVTVKSMFCVNRNNNLQDKYVYPELMVRQGTDTILIETILGKELTREKAIALICTGVADLNLRDFDDDIVILGKTFTGNVYYFLYYDLSLHDCSIGRFESCLPEEIIVKLFDKYAHSVNAKWDNGDITKIPTEYYNNKGFIEWRE